MQVLQVPLMMVFVFGVFLYMSYFSLKLTNSFLQSIINSVATLKESHIHNGVVPFSLSVSPLRTPQNLKEQTWFS